MCVLNASARARMPPTHASEDMATMKTGQIMCNARYAPHFVHRRLSCIMRPAWGGQDEALPSFSLRDSVS